MSSAFIVAARDAQARAFDWFGELFDFIPMSEQADRTAPQIPAADRDALTGDLGLRGVYYAKPADALIRNGYDPRTDQRPGVSTMHPRIEISADFAGVDVRTGDILVRQSSRRRYRIAATSSKPTGVLVCTINFVG